MISAQVLVVGAGPAGIAAATAAATHGRRVVLLDDNASPGGQIWRQSTVAPPFRRTKETRRTQACRRGRSETGDGVAGLRRTVYRHS